MPRPHTATSDRHVAERSPDPASGRAATTAAWLLIVIVSAPPLLSALPVRADTESVRIHGRAGACRNCHGSMLPANHTARFLHVEHGIAARLAGSSCIGCHDPGRCLDCHETDKPAWHDAGVDRPDRNPEGGRRHAALARARLATCRACHERNEPRVCRSCHEPFAEFRK